MAEFLQSKQKAKKRFLIYTQKVVMNGLYSLPDSDLTKHKNKALFFLIIVVKNIWLLIKGGYYVISPTDSYP